jgi:hypothetical protein
VKTLPNPLTKTLLLALAFGAFPAFAGDPATTGALATKANRIVGTWLAVGDVSGANCFPSSLAPAIKPNVYLMYHAGGTITELPRLPSNAAQAARTFGVGNWYYEPATDTYFVSFRFDWYSGGLLGGHATVDREIKLDPDGNSLSGSVVATRYDLNGIELYSQCGTGTGTRL